jgi:hypothetical protein
VTKSVEYLDAVEECTDKLRIADGKERKRNKWYEKNTRMV